MGNHQTTFTRSCNSAIPLLGMQPTKRELHAHPGTRVSMFTVVPLPTPKPGTTHKPIKSSGLWSRAGIINSDRNDDLAAHGQAGEGRKPPVG